MATSNKNNKRTPQTTIIKVGANEMGKLPPQAQELEDSVLGAIMLEKEAYGSVADCCVRRSFTRTRIEWCTKPSANWPRKTNRSTP